MFGFRFLNLKVITLFLSLLMLGAGGVLFQSTMSVLNTNNIEWAAQIQTVQIAAGVFVLAALAIVWLLLSILSSLQATTKCLAEAASGDVNSRMLHINGNTEIDRMKGSVNRLLDVTEVFLKESEASLKAISRKAYYRKIIETGMPGIYGKSAAGISLVMDLIKDKEMAFERDLKDMTNKFDANITAFLGELATSSSGLKTIADDLSMLSGTSLDQSRG
ncbi:MAG: hypothetical protein AAB276_06735, partial [Pseudomonadota bacterium]